MTSTPNQPDDSLETRLEMIDRQLLALITGDLKPEQSFLGRIADAVAASDGPIFPKVTAQDQAKPAPLYYAPNGEIVSRMQFACSHRVTPLPEFTPVSVDIVSNAAYAIDWRFSLRVGLTWVSPGLSILHLDHPQPNQPES